MIIRGSPVVKDQHGEAVCGEHIGKAVQAKVLLTPLHNGGRRGLVGVTENLTTLKTADHSCVNMCEPCLRRYAGR